MFFSHRTPTGLANNAGEAAALFQFNQQEFELILIALCFLFKSIF